MTTLKHFMVCLVLAVLVVPLAVPEAFGQDRPRRSLFEVLFGSDDQQTQQAAPPAQAPAQAQPRRTQPAPAPAPRRQSAPAPARQASAPAPAPAADKAEDATRIAVMGDSLAVDLARAMQRFYADDPQTAVLGMGVGSSGFVRDDFHDWNRTLTDALSADRFDIAVVAIGINDRQALGGSSPLSDGWRQAYSARLDRFLDALRAEGKPVVWIELPPMEQPSYSADMVQISALHREAVTAAGGEWVETYERYMGPDGGYAASGPDLNGQTVSMRKSDGIHFSDAGSDKLAFYVDGALGRHYSGGGLSVEVADLLAGTDAAGLLRPPFQGLGQMRLYETAGSIRQIGGGAQRAGDLLLADLEAGPVRPSAFALEDLLAAPSGRVDAFGVGRSAEADGPVVENPTGR
ncbi:SGNH/GDSL hydrolase family protein [Pelagibacterium montanilacus]|uniref:SGNH/GDSL hydrolase family protein n=1 Tax=Pelagibacterium montanilacus TaxID=2185280 RepID=UPI000F8D67DB|nr:DUF459 domain-containing protein [Pelagibacterium montanilacus]